VNEAQEFGLLSGQHVSFPVAAVPKDSLKQILNRHYLFYMCSATT
jgi:hypothetical protein